MDKHILTVINISFTIIENVVIITSNFFRADI